MLEQFQGEYKHNKVDLLVSLNTLDRLRLSPSKLVIFTMDSKNEVPPGEEQRYIESFSRRVIREKSGNYPPLKRSIEGSLIYLDAGGISSNRGNKLLQSSELVTRRALNNSKPIDEDCVYYNGSEHNLLQRRKRMRLSKGDEDELDNEDDEEYEGLSHLVDVRKVLTPISSLADVARHEPVSHAFRSKVLRDLALQTMLMIEKEQQSVIRYGKLLEVFLGDYPQPLYEANLNLPDYDHNLRLPEEGETDIDDKNKLDVKYEDVEDNDPFFALPGLNESDAILNILPDANSPEVDEEVEIARQLAQIALQRNQEFVRNLQKVRNALIKAARIKERIYAWSEEYAGIPQEGVTVPNALRVVKRGLISATTNRSMGGEVDEAGGEEEEEEEN